MAIEMRSLCPLIQVYDMPTAMRFYRDVLGFEIFSTSPPAAPTTLTGAGSSAAEPN